jgi:hypothetical protein
MDQIGEYMCMKEFSFFVLKNKIYSYKNAPFVFQCFNDLHSFTFTKNKH